MTAHARRRDLLALAALALAMLAAVQHYRRVLEATQVIERTGPGYARAAVQDALIGRTIDLGRLGIAPDPAEAGAEAPRRPALIWVLDLDRCQGCFDSVTEWAQLERLAEHDRHMVLTGEPTSDVLARLRVLRATSVVRNLRDSVTALLGPTLANTKLLVDPTGIILLADSRSSGQDCGWSFEAQVGALRGLGSAARIRPAVTKP